MPTEYYILEARQRDWVFILTRLLDRHNPEPSDVRITIEEGYPVYHIRKGLVPAAELAAAIGATADQVTFAHRIKLYPFKDDPGLPKPTVAYVGEA